MLSYAAMIFVQDGVCETVIAENREFCEGMICPQTFSVPTNPVADTPVTEISAPTDTEPTEAVPELPVTNTLDVIPIVPTAPVPATPVTAVSTGTLPKPAMELLASGAKPNIS